MFKTENLYQNDEKWKDVRLGNSSETIGTWGCLLTSVTMMLNGIGYNETPVTVNEKMKKNNGFQGALFIPSVVPYLWTNCAYRGMTPCESYPAPIAKIDAEVAAGKPVILQVDWSQQVGIQTHYVLVKEKQGDDYVIYDPYRYSGDGPNKDVLLTRRYKYNGAKLASEISAVLWFDVVGAEPADPPKMTQIPLPTEQYVVYVAVDDLALRAEPSQNGYLWKRLMMETELTSLEPAETARGKVGVNGEWLQVQDPDGNQGYVAAWYLTDVRGQPPSIPAGTSGSQDQETSLELPPGALAFFPTAELSFRAQPIIAPETLIRRIPVNEQIISIEPVSEVIRKVGVEGQWLKVKDASNRVGYVAAWYVRYASGSAAQASAGSPAAASNGGPMKVRTTAHGVALRHQPVVTAASLIKRLPLGAELTILEPGGESKIGRNDQWIKVRDTRGTEGFVAAWFVTR